MEPVYWKSEGLKYAKNPNKIYCKVKNCKHRATNLETHLCGFHEKFSNDDIVSNFKPPKLNDRVLYYFPQKEEFYKRRPFWLMKMK